MGAETRAARIVTALVVALAVGACAEPDPYVSTGTGRSEQVSAENDGSRPLPERSRGERGEVRNDLEPLLERFPALGRPVAASWQGGALEEGWFAVGPSTLWLEAVVELEPATAQRLRESTGPTAAPAPAVHEDLAEEVPDGPWLAGDDLDAAFRSADGWSGRVFLDAGRPVVVLHLLHAP